MGNHSIKHFSDVSELKDLDKDALMGLLKETHDNVHKAFEAWSLTFSKDNAFITLNPELARNVFKGEIDESLNDFELIYQAICEKFGKAD